MSVEVPNAADTEALALARRSGWPEDLRVLIARYPREQWQGHANLGEMARFWLSRHAMFRELAAMIGRDRSAIPRRHAAAGGIPAAVRAAAAVPAVAARRASPDRGPALFSDLPRRRRRAWRAASTCWKSDHHAIHADMAATAETANALLRALVGEADALHALRRRLRGGERRAAQGADAPSRRRGRPDRAADPRPRRGRARRRARVISVIPATPRSGGPKHSPQRRRL